MESSINILQLIFKTSSAPALPATPAVCAPVTVVSGDKYDGRFIVENLLTQEAQELPEKTDSTTKTNYWVAPNGKAASFVLNLGCPLSFKAVKLVNIHNRSYKDRSTKQFK